MKRRRWLYFLGVCVCIVLGLASRRFSESLPAILSHNAGDILWALMVFYGVGFGFNRWSSNRVAVAALLFSFADEISQCYHAPWIDAVRHTRLGGLVLGYEFLWSDLVCYMVGVGLGWLGEKLLIRQPREL